MVGSKQAILAMTALILAVPPVFAQSATGTDEAAASQATAETRPMPKLPEGLDANGDGSVTRDEIEALAAARFSEADGNGDGQISLEELLAAHQAEADARRQAGAERMLTRLDSDESGSLSAEEFAGRSTRMLENFDNLDANGDGALSAEELREAKHGKGHGRKGGGRKGGEREGGDRGADS